MNKYSQVGQDDWVLSVIGNKGYFVDWGAYDGVHYSNTLKLEEAGWDGLCIEANPKNFELLKQNRKCKLLNQAIATYRGDLRMSDDESSSQKSTTGNIWVKCDLIKNIFRFNKVPKYIDYISSDIERMDAEIWHNFPFSEYSFGVATIEHCLYEGSDSFKKIIMEVMLKNGYIVAKENVEHEGNKFEDLYINQKLVV